MTDLTRRGAAQSRPALSFGSWAFAFGPFEPHPWPFDRIARYLSEAGYDAIEINGFRPHPHDEDFDTAAKCAPLRDLLDGLGLDISAYAPDFRSTPPADVELDRYLARVDSTLAFCRNMGIKVLRTDTVSPPGPMDQRRHARLISAWRVAAQHAEDSGVRLIWEFEPGFWLNRPTQVLRTVEEVDHENFSVLFDSSHAFTGAVMGARQGPDPEILPGGAAEYARLLSGHIGHLHLIDSDGTLHNDETSSHIPFGQGKIDFAELITAAADEFLALPHWTVDFCFCDTAESDGRDAVGYVRELLNQAHDQRRARDQQEVI